MNYIFNFAELCDLKTKVVLSQNAYMVVGKWTLYKKKGKILVKHYVIVVDNFKTRPRKVFRMRSTWTLRQDSLCDIDTI